MLWMLLSMSPRSLLLQRVGTWRAMTHRFLPCPTNSVLASIEDGARVSAMTRPRRALPFARGSSLDDAAQAQPSTMPHVAHPLTRSHSGPFIHDAAHGASSIMPPGAFTDDAASENEAAEPQEGA